MIELHVRFGVAEDEPREIRTYTFATETLRQAFIDGMWELSTNHAGNYDIVQRNIDGSFPSDPEWDYEEEETCE